MPMTRPPAKGLLRRYVPIVYWLPGYGWKSDIRWDVLAGLTVWALLVPEAMAYAGIAGVPPEAGLYTAPLALLGYAVFGTSKHLFVGPSSTVAIVSASVVGGIVAGSAADFWTITAWLAVLTGLVLILLGIMRLGWVSNFMARPVLEGFIIGLAVTIAIGQADKLFGIEKEGSNAIQQAYSILNQFADWHLATAVVGVGSLLALFLMHKYTPRVPAALALVGVAIILSVLFGLDDMGLHIIGDIPAGLPSFGLPSWPDGLPIDDLIVGAFAVSIVAYAESVAAAKEYARTYGYAVDANQELVGLGFANLGAGLSQGFVVDGSLSKTAAGAAAGQRTQMAGLVAATLTVVTVLFLTRLFFYLPEATLGAIVVHAVSNLIDLDKLKRMWAVRKEDFWAATLALVGVLVLGILPGILIGVAMSILILIYRTSFPSATELGQITTEQRNLFVSIENFPDAERTPTVVVHRFNADLIFSNASTFSDSVLNLVYDADPPARTVVLDCEMMADMDMTGAETLRELVDQLRDHAIDIRLARLHGAARATAERSGVVETIGVGNVHLTVAAAVRATKSDNGS